MQCFLVGIGTGTLTCVQVLCRIWWAVPTAAHCCLPLLLGLCSHNKCPSHSDIASWAKHSSVGRLPLCEGKVSEVAELKSPLVAHQILETVFSTSSLKLVSPTSLLFFDEALHETLGLWLSATFYQPSKTEVCWSPGSHSPSGNAYTWRQLW